MTIVSNNGLSLERCQAIIWTNVSILPIGPLGTSFNEILIEMQSFSLNKLFWKILSAKCQPFCFGLIVLRKKNFGEWDNPWLTHNQKWLKIKVTEFAKVWPHDDVIQWKKIFHILAHCVGNSPVTGEFTSQRPVTWSFDVFFDLCLNKLLSKQSRCWWFETPPHSL